MKNKIVLNFYGVFAEIYSDWNEILDYISKDFFSFKYDPNSTYKADFKLTIVKADAPIGLIPEIQTSMQTQSSLSYDIRNERFNDYYGELVSHINFSTNEATLYSTNFSKMHEVCYLIILSRIGKQLDLMGLHKLHAFAVSFKGIAVLCMMPSKGGKSTLLMELLKDSRFKMISDDIPLINRWGKVMPFPLKIGLENLNSDLKILNPEKNIYEMKRTLHGVKKLISVEGIPNQVEPVSQVFDQVILIEAFRVNSAHSYLGVISWIRSFKGLFKHGIIGFGLPMVIEYFWENGPRDFMVKTFIFCSRLLSFLLLSFRAKKLRLHLGKKPDKAAKEITYFLEKVTRNT